MVRTMASLRSVAGVDVGEQICLGRQRSGLRVVNSLVDHGRDLGVDGVEVGSGELAGLDHPGSKTFQAVQLGPRMLDLAGPVGLLVALEVAEVAGELHLNERRTTALTGAADRLARRLVHREEVETVDDDARHAEPGRAVGNVVAGHRPGAGCGLGIPVVLGDAVGTEHALGQVGDVHRAALAMAAAGLTAVDLGHHFADVNALGDAVAVAAMGTGDGVTVVKVAAYADRRSLLPCVQVDESRNLAGRELRVHAFLELADRPHRSVDAHQLLWSQSSPLHRVGHVLLLDGRCLQILAGPGSLTGASEQAEASTRRQDRWYIHTPRPVSSQPDSGLFAWLEGELTLAVDDDDAGLRIDRMNGSGAHRLDRAYPYRHDQPRCDWREDL